MLPFTSSHRSGILHILLVAVLVNVSIAFQNLPVPKYSSAAGTTARKTTTQQYSVIDTLASIGNVAPPQPMLNGKKKLLQTLLKDTYLASNVDNMKCVYKASRDGWSAIDFHNCVDNRGSGLVVARTRTGITLGGFNPNGWRSTDDYYLSNAAFLWYAKGNNNINNNNSAVKCPIGSSSNAAVYDYATGGPCFGSADFVLGEPKAAVMGGFTGPDMEDSTKNAGSLRTGKCGFSGAYDFDKGWPVRGQFSLVEVEVYCNGDGSTKKKSFW